jgi:hypothetical protein
MLPFAEVSPGGTDKGFRRRPNFLIGHDSTGIRNDGGIVLNQEGVN